MATVAYGLTGLSFSCETRKCGDQRCLGTESRTGSGVFFFFNVDVKNALGKKRLDFHTTLKIFCSVSARVLQHNEIQTS